MIRRAYDFKPANVQDIGKPCNQPTEASSPFVSVTTQPTSSPRKGLLIDVDYASIIGGATRTLAMGHRTVSALRIPLCIQA